jgi:hypothetical protein
VLVVSTLIFAQAPIYESSYPGTHSDIDLLSISEETANQWHNSDSKKKQRFTEFLPSVNSLDDSVMVELMGHWSYGPCADVATWDSILYVGNGPSVLIYQLLPDESPEQLGQITFPHALWGLLIQDSLAYVRYGGDVHIYRIMGATQWEYLSTLGSSVQYDDMIVVDSLLVISGFGGDIEIFNVADPLEPFLLAQTSVLDEHPVALAIVNRHLYVGGLEYPWIAHKELTAADSIINHPDIWIEGYAYAHRFAVYDTLLMMVGAGGSGWGSLFDTYSVTRTGELSLLDRIMVDTIFTAQQDGLLKQDSVIYLSLRERLVQVDISDPSNLAIMSYLSQPPQELHSFSELALWQDQLTIALIWGAWRVRAQPGTPLESLDIIPTGYFLQDFSVSGDTLYVASGYAGGWVVDISDPTLPSNITNWPIGNVRSILKHDNLAFLKLGGAQFQDMIGIYDISTPEEPLQLGEYYTQKIWGMRLFNEYSLAVMNLQSLELLDVQDPQNPISLGQVTDSTIIRFRGLQVQPPWMFVSAVRAGIQIWNWEDPTNPMQADTLLPPPFTGQFLVRDSLLFTVYHRLGSDTLWLLTYDVHQPVSAGLISRFRIPESPDYALEMKFAYSDSSIIWVRPSRSIGGGTTFGKLDMRDPENPELTGITQYPGTIIPDAVRVQDEYVYLLNAVNGVFIFRLTDSSVVSVHQDPSIPQALHLYQNYPNPFNVSTTIQFFTAIRTRISLQVFDLRGRLVETVFRGMVPSGIHTYSFSNSQLSSGVYFYRLKNHDTGIAYTRKMMLLR